MLKPGHTRTAVAALAVVVVLSTLVLCGPAPAPAAVPVLEDSSASPPRGSTSSTRVAPARR